jgi:bacillolysin
MIRNIKRVLILYLVIILNISIYSQNDSTFLDAKLSIIADSTSRNVWIILKKNVNIYPSEFFSEFRNTLGLCVDDSMEIISESKDEKGIVHTRFQQYYKGTKIEDCILIIHSKDRRVDIINGIYAKNINININSAISEKVALLTALEHVNSKKYLWEDTLYERKLKKETQNPNATYYPKGEVLICLINDSLPILSDNLALAYKFVISSAIPFNKKEIYIDANNGNFIKERNLIFNCVVGAAITSYNGYQSINMDKWMNSNGIFCKKYRLFDDCRGKGIHTCCWFKPDYPESHYNCNLKCDEEEITDGNGYFAFSDTKSGASAHWAAEKAFDYFYNKHGLYSFDNTGHLIKIYVNNDSGGQEENAFWDGNDLTLNFGSGNAPQSGPFVSLDIVGHELTHGITQCFAGLNYSGESGALNESFSDIFGTMIEFYGQNGSGDFEMGEDVAQPGPLRRSLQNPSFYPTKLTPGSPDTYHCTFWYYGSEDNGGVHINSGVQNFWFYLLCVGGSGVNDISNYYCVEAIGKEKAAAIVYNNLRYYMTPTSDYFASRQYSIQAAINIFGENSNEVVQVTNAWYAVGVGNIYQGIVMINNHIVSGTEKIANFYEVNLQNLFVPKNTSLTVTSSTKIVIKPILNAINGSFFNAKIEFPCK